ncbi:MAG TPA: ATP-binding protein [Candidatus Binatia bacterium]|nr:ATP-binding protein [Candidatus Binatia bacterium]
MGRTKKKQRSATTKVDAETPRRILRVLLSRFSVSAQELATELGLTAQAVRLQLRELEHAGLVAQEDAKQQRNRRYFCTESAISSPPAGIEPTSQDEKIGRQLRKAIEHSWRKQVLSWRTSLRTVVHELPGGVRPNWFFDVYGILHPAVTVGSRGIITAWSPALVELIRAAHPDLVARLGSPDGLRFVDCDKGDSLLARLDIKPYKPESDELVDAHALHAPGGIAEQLAAHGHVNKYPVLATLPSRDDGSTRQAFLEISIVPHRAFVGMQSIMPVVSDRINALRQLAHESLVIPTLQHRLAQPFNVIGVQEASLRKWLSDGMFNSLPQAQTKLRGVVDALLRSVKDIGAQLQGLPSPTTISLSPVDLVSTLEAAVNDAERSQDGTPRVPVAASYAVSRGRAFVTAIPFLLREGLLNLIHNALKASGGRPSTRIEVTLERGRSGQAIVRIVDHGVGMSQDQMRQMNTDALTRRPARVGDVSGEYSGSALAMMVVAMCRGSIVYSSTSGGGTTVTLTLPITETI